MRIYDPKKILVPVDLSEFTLGVLRAAVDIAEKWDAETLVLHVAREADQALPPAANLGGYKSPYTASFYDRGKLLEKAQERIEAQLQALLQQAAAGPKVRAEMVWGEPLQEILRTAETGDYDLIVMGTHGRRGLSRFLIGSVTEQAIRRASCPVLAIRAKIAEARFVPAEMGREALN